MEIKKDIFDDDLIEGIVKKQAVLREFENSHQTKSEFVRSHDICRSTLHRYLSRRSESGFKGLIDRRKTRTKKGIRIDDNYTEIILTFLVDHPKAPVTMIHAEMKKVGVLNGWSEPPTYDKVWRFCRSVPPDIITQWRDGRKERVESKSLTVRREVSTVNALWQCDFSEIPYWTFDPVFGPDLFKPWIVGTICGASRVVPGTLVCKTVGSAEIVSCWRKAMLPKGSPSCPFYGVPSVVSMDNHKAFKGDAWQSLVSLCVEPLNINNDSPEENGKIERWFKTLQTRLFSYLDGFADQHQGKNKARIKCIPYPLLQKLVDDFILEYHLTEHSTLEMTPWEAWHRGLAEAHGLLIETDEIDRSLRVSTEVKVSAQGVQVNNRHFTGAFLEGILDHTVSVRFPPEGPRDTVTVYENGMLLGEACEHINTELAAEITATRLDRTIEIGRLTKAIRERTAQQPPVKIPESSAVKPAKEIAEVEPLNDTNSSARDDHDSLGSIPDLASTEEPKHE